MSEVIKVGMADMKICNSPDALTTLGLGSCVGIALWDQTKKLGGLVHIMLPDSTKIMENANAYKFADTGIIQMVREMEKLGAVKNHMVAKIAGGAQMFKFASSASTTRIGERNVEATIERLEILGIPIIASDVGGSFGRTVTFYPECGAFKISTVGKEMAII